MNDVKLSIHIENARAAKQWRNLISCFDIEVQNVIVRNEISTEWSSRCTEYFKLSGNVDSDDSVVVIQPQDHTNTVSKIQVHEIVGRTNLLEYSHPQHCVYLFGPNYGKLTERELEMYRVVDIVYIPTTIQFLYSWTAAGIVLYDRLSKLR